MATKKNKRVEVISPKIKCFTCNITFEQILNAVNEKKVSK